jgi:hypothetical protein
MLNGVDANSYSSNITEVTSFGGAGPLRTAEILASRKAIGRYMRTFRGSGLPISRNSTEYSAANFLCLPTI